MISLLYELVMTHYSVDGVHMSSRTDLGKHAIRTLAEHGWADILEDTEIRVVARRRHGGPWG